MIFFKRYVLISLFCFMLTVLLFACGKPKEGKVIISQQEFSVRQDSDHSWVIDAKGKVKNVGDADVKNVVVTGYCISCGEVLVMGAWFISNVPKTADEKDTIAYLPAGAEADFSFKGVAFMMDTSGKSPEKMPDKMQCKILSFETVQK